MTNTGHGTADFLSGGGEMGALMRAHDWSTTGLGSTATWPQSLRTTVSLMLNSRFPMFVAWGRDLNFLYNDGYTPIFGKKHPHMLGTPFADAWREIWTDILPLVDRALAGEATLDENLHLVMERNGYPEDTWYTFSYSPVRDETGGIGGMFCACWETTQQVLARRKEIAERERLSRLFEQSPSFMAMIEGIDYRYTLANPAYLTLAGRTGIIGKTFAEALPDAVEQGFLDLLDEVRASGKTYAANGARYDRQLNPAAPAESRFVDFIFQPIIDTDNAVTGIFIEGYDVTERRATEAALRESEARFRAAVSAVNGVLWTNSADGEMLGEQPGWAMLTGQAQDEYQGYGWADAVHPDDQRPTIDEWNVALGERRPFVFEHRVRRHDGEWRQFAIRAVPSFDADGTITEWVGVHTDITEARAAEAALKAAEVRATESARDLQDVVETMPGFVWTADAQGGLVYTSPSWHDYSGSRAEDSAGSGWAGFVHPDDQPEAFARWANSLVTGEPYEVEFRLRAADGSYHWWLARARRQDDGEVRWIGIATELDDIVAARETLAQSREELETLVAARTAELRQAEDQLRQSQKLEAIGQLTGGVAHDFNNLLTVIRGSVDLLRRPGLTEERRDRYIDAISETVTRAAKLTGQLLAFARRQALKPDVFDVSVAVRAISDMIGTLVGSRIHVVTQFPEDPCFVDADTTQFDTALVNMAVNARDAMKGEGALTITVRNCDAIPALRSHPRVGGKFAAISLTDTGTGIAPDRLDQIFEPFFTTKEVGHGTGLGLSQVYGFTHQSGGQIHVESTPGTGSTFTLYLPRSEAAPCDQVRNTQTGIIPGEGRCVLVVEDNAEVGSFARHTLAELGYEATFASDAATALSVLSHGATAFDVVFSDVVMPGMNGVDLAREIEQRYPELPVVLTSGYSHVLAAEGTGGFDLLRKPYSMEELSRALGSARVRAQPKVETTGG